MFPGKITISVGHLPVPITTVVTSAASNSRCSAASWSATWHRKGPNPGRSHVYQLANPPNVTNIDAVCIRYLQVIHMHNHGDVLILQYAYSLIFCIVFKLVASWWSIWFLPECQNVSWNKISFWSPTGTILSSHHRSTPPLAWAMESHQPARLFKLSPTPNK